MFKFFNLFKKSHKSTATKSTTNTPVAEGWVLSDSYADYYGNITKIYTNARGGYRSIPCNANGYPLNLNDRIFLGYESRAVSVSSGRAILPCYLVKCGGRRYTYTGTRSDLLKALADRGMRDYSIEPCNGIAPSLVEGRLIPFN